MIFLKIMQEVLELKEGQQIIIHPKSHLIEKIEIFLNNTKTVLPRCSVDMSSALNFKATPLGWISRFSNNDICFFPIPDKDYKLIITYIDNK